MWGKRAGCCKTNIRGGWGLRTAIEEWSSLPQPPDLTLDQLEGGKYTGTVGIWVKEGVEKERNLKLSN